MTFDRPKYMRVYHKKWYRQNKEKVDHRNRLYAAEHKSKVAEYKHDWYRTNKDRLDKMARLEHKRNPLNRKRNWLKSLYKLTLEQYDEMMAIQKGECAICYRKPAKRALDVDHNHETKKVRGLLCSNCNRGLGMFKKNISFLQAAQIYLREDQSYGH